MTKQDQDQQLMATLPTLYCTVGLPFSGKATWAACQGLPVVSLAANETVINNSSSSTNNKTTQKGKTAPDPLAFTKQLIECLFAADNKVVILLAENLTEQERQYWQDEAGASWQTVFREFQISEKEALRKATAAGVSKQELSRIRELSKKMETFIP
jgi:predicted kinase